MAIYLHKGCFDGVTSGALAMWFLRERGATDDPVLVPIDYDEAATWLACSLESRSCVVDFLYHPSATYWWDHHGNPFRQPQWREEYERRLSPYVQWDPRARSCAGLMVRIFTSSDLDVPVHLRRTADWADQIDSASYPTPEDAVVQLSAARQLALSLRVDSTVSYHTALARALTEVNVEDVVRRPPFVATVEEAKAQYARGVEQMRNTAKLDGNIVVYSLDNDDILSDRLVPFFLHRAADYSVGILRKGHQVKVTANANPWHPSHGPDLGRIFASHGGGGHHDVGSVIIKGADVSPEEIVREVLEVLQS
jgi:hypothetical protein